MNFKNIALRNKSGLIGPIGDRIIDPSRILEDLVLSIQEDVRRERH